MSEPSPNRPFTIVFLGPTGTGKSFHCSKILGIPDAFQSSNSPTSFTSQTSSRMGRWGNAPNGALVLAVDTPGFADSQNRDLEHVENISCFLRTLCTGVNVFVVALNGCLPRWDVNYQRMMSILQGMFGEAFWNHVMIAFTKCDLDRDGQPQSVWANVDHAAVVQTIRTTHNVPTSAELPFLRLNNSTNAGHAEMQAFALRKGWFSGGVLTDIAAIQRMLAQSDEERKRLIVQLNDANNQSAEVQRQLQERMDSLKHKREEAEAKQKKILAGIAALAISVFTGCSIL